MKVNFVLITSLSSKCSRSWLWIAFSSLWSRENWARTKKLLSPGIPESVGSSFSPQFSLSFRPLLQNACCSGLFLLCYFSVTKKKLHYGVLDWCEDWWLCLFVRARCINHFVRRGFKNSKSHKECIGLLALLVFHPEYKMKDRLIATSLPGSLISPRLLPGAVRWETLVARLM